MLLPPGLLERTEHFYAWEVRGRGWLSYPYRVALEPPFRPFVWYQEERPALDDGRRPTALSRLADRLIGRAPEPMVAESAPTREPDVPEVEYAPVEETLLLLPPGARVSTEAGRHWLQSLAMGRAPSAFELVSQAGQISLQLASRAGDTERLLGTLRALVPEVVALPAERPLAEEWHELPGYGLVVEFGLAREWLLSLQTPGSLSPDPLTAVLAGLASTRDDELAVVQTLLSGTSAPWAESAIRSVVTPSGQPFFLDAPEFTRQAQEKAGSPLVAVVLRIGLSAETEERTWKLLENVALGLTALTQPSGNELIPVWGVGYRDLEADLLDRATHRPGMLLSLDELLGLVHLPDASLVLPELVRLTDRTVPVPPVLQGDGVLVGENRHQGVTSAVRLPDAVRLRHVHVVGASGTGKSTLLARIILEDLERGAGVGLIDPHGDLVDAVLARLPDDRVHDVVLLDPVAADSQVGWNLLEARSDTERELLASDLVALFRRQATSSGDQMTSVLGNAIQALLEHPEGGTLLDLRRFLADRRFREQFLAAVRDPYVVEYWRETFPLLKGQPTGPILTRLDTFLRSKLIRRVVAGTGALDLRDFIDRGGVLLAKLAQGTVGTENAALLGALLVSSIHRSALSRADQAAETRRPFYLYLDEFHEVATPSMASLFTGARKFRLAVTAARQNLYQLHRALPEVERAVLGNAETRIVFRVGEEDARSLARGFGHFAEDDLLALSVGEAIVRSGGRTMDCNVRTAPLTEVSSEVAKERRERVAERMREQFPRAAEDESREPPSEPEEPPRPGKAPSAPEPAPREPMATAPEPARTPPRERTEGRGGPEHSYLQSLVARFAKDRGFRVELEERIEGGVVDVSLRRDELSIAVEIAVTSTPEQEASHVQRALAADFRLSSNRSGSFQAVFVRWSRGWVTEPGAWGVKAVWCGRRLQAHGVPALLGSDKQPWREEPPHAPDHCTASSSRCHVDVR